MAAPDAVEKNAEQPTEAPLGALQEQLRAADQVLAPLAKVGKAIGALGDTGTDQRAALKQALAGASQVQNQLPGLKAAFAEAERTVGPYGGGEAVASLEKHLGELLRELKQAARNLEGEDKLESFEIQELMADYNEAERHASNLLKKRDDTQNAIIGKT